MDKYEYIFLFVVLNIVLYNASIISKHIWNSLKKNSPYFYTTSSKYNISGRIRVALLTNEIPPIVYGGVATWIVNFINMFSEHSKLEIIPVFLAYNDTLPIECIRKYPNIRIINQRANIVNIFSDIDICINNLWISLETIKYIKELYSHIPIITVCHSLIRMEHITNLGSVYTNNFNDQEITFQHSDYVVLISKAEKKYYTQFGYDSFQAKTRVIYNSYIPSYDNCEYNDCYDNSNIGYIGRHVPRKRPEIPILATKLLELKDVMVYNMGVDYDKYENSYWKKLEKEFPKQLKVIPFSTDELVKKQYWDSIGIGCITGIYEPFGYTICECIDRGVPVIVQNIDGPKEIIDEVREFVYVYDVDYKDYEQDIENFAKTLTRVLKISPDVRRSNALAARKCLNKLRPNIISLEWENLIREALDRPN